MNAFLVPLLFFIPAGEPIKPKVPVGKETTYVTGPINKNGYIDYEAALNERLGKGITPEKNANVLLWKAFGPKPGVSEGQPAEYFKLLGIEEPPASGDYFTDLEPYLKDRLQLEADDIATVQDWFTHAKQRPWNAKEYAEIAAWLKTNEKPLAIVLEASKRPQYFNPLVGNRDNGERSELLGALTPSIWGCRQAAHALATRAMVRVNEGKFDAAWEDLLACHRLGRFVSRGATLLEALTGYAIHRTATEATLAYLDRANLTSKQLQAQLKELQNLPPLSPIADKMELGERFIILDTLQCVHRCGMGELNALAGEPGAGEKPTKEERKALDQFDWSIPFRNTNKWYDRIVLALRIKNRADRAKELDKLEEDFKKLIVRVNEARDDGKLEIYKVKPDQETAKLIGDYLLRLMMTAYARCQDSYDIAQQTEHHLHVAFALVAYRKDNNRYPAKLAGLAPKYLASVPDDLFSGKPLIYKPSEKGYLFYSVGVNGKDDDGHWSDDNPPGDDPRVRMPLPEVKNK